ncbi:MAG: hypothetical protein M3Q49_21520 [Actinomycetota bacterium]|nr:hypothetical protein [Actinomycetota bacterium]
MNRFFRTTRRRGLATVAALGLVAALPAVAAAHDTATSYDGAIDHAKVTHDHHQDGGDGGHLAPKSYGVDLVSKLALKNVEPEKLADVGVHKGYAYLAAWGGATCKYNGVHVVDVRNPAAPKDVAFIVAKEGSAPGEGVQALTLRTSAFKGDVLVTNNEKCKDKAGFGGMNIYDVTNPKAPVPLAVGFGDATVMGQGKKGANETHSVFAWQAGTKAYAVMVDNEEGPDVDIVDISALRPEMVAEYDLDERFPQIAQQGLDEVFLHDMVVKEIGGRQVMLLSYWDGGYVQLDVTNPADAKYLADSDYSAFDPEMEGVKPEGNGHQAEFTSDNRFVIGTDEDFSPYSLITRNDTDRTDITAGSGSDTKQVKPGTTVSGGTTYVGRACNGDAAVPAAPEKSGTDIRIAVVERGVCTFTEKVANVERAGWDAAVIFNREGSDACNASLGMSVEGAIHAFGVLPREQGYAIFNQPGYDDAKCRAGSGALSGIAMGAKGDRLTFGSYFDGWGYVQLFEGTTMEILDTYAVDEAHDEKYATGFGDLSVHEVATSAKNPNLGYLSYYSAGLRLVEIQDNKLVEVGAFLDDGGNNFWGVEVFTGADGTEYVAASDRDHGLYIFKKKG